jgi:hypothetical protein
LSQIHLSKIYGQYFYAQLILRFELFQPDLNLIHGKKKRLRIEHGVKYERKARRTNRHGGLILTAVLMDEERNALIKCDGFPSPCTLSSCHYSIAWLHTRSSVLMHIRYSKVISQTFGPIASESRLIYLFSVGLTIIWT